jgi:hypothetical protein
MCQSYNERRLATVGRAEREYAALPPTPDKQQYREIVPFSRPVSRGAQLRCRQADSSA